MRRAFVVVPHPEGRRVYVVRRRVHHGFAGVLIMTIGAWLAWTDRRDWKQWWFQEIMR